MLVPVNDVSVLYGVYLLITLGCTYYVIYDWKKRESSKKEWSKWNEVWPKIFAFIIVALLFLFQNVARHDWSYEASAHKTLNNIMDEWEKGNKKEVIEFINHHALAQKPWNPSSDYSE